VYLKKSLFLKFVLVILVMIISLYVIHRYMEYSKLPKESPPTRKDEPDKIKLKNNEWIKSLNILYNSKIWFVDYCGSLDFTKDNYNSKPIEVNIRCNLEYMNEVVDRDTQFIKDNPSYFKKDHKRMIYCRDVSYIYKDEYYGYKNYTYTKDENLDFIKDGAFTSVVYKLNI